MILSLKQEFVTKNMTLPSCIDHLIYLEIYLNLLQTSLNLDFIAVQNPCYIIPLGDFKIKTKTRCYNDKITYEGLKPITLQLGPDQDEPTLISSTELYI